MSQFTEPSSVTPAKFTPVKPVIHYNYDSKAYTLPGYERLFKMLSYKRPHASESEAAFVEEFIQPYEPITYTNDKGEVLAYGIKVGESETLFSAHVDTVHWKGGWQIPVYKGGWLLKEDNECLGADDGAGVWLLLEMIDKEVPGYYLFHRGEEKGGIGSRGMALHHETLLSAFKRAVAFDRRGISSVITEQGFVGRCASDAFADALSAALNIKMPDDYAYFLPDDTGVYTDTAEYTEIIPECTNISCGYYSEHTGNERLDLDFLFALRDACVQLDWEALPTVRKPEAPDYGAYGVYGFTGRSSPQYKHWELGSYLSVDDVMSMSHAEIVKWAKTAPSVDIADLIYDLVSELDTAMYQNMADAASVPDDAESGTFEIDFDFHGSLDNKEGEAS